MGTRADFYTAKYKIDGTPYKLKWIGSIAYDGNPDSISQRLLKCVSIQGFKSHFKNFVKFRDDVTWPENGWPWPWDDSSITDYTYIYDDEENQIFVNAFHGEYDKVTGSYPFVYVGCRNYNIREKNYRLPNMSKLKNIAAAGTARSGVIRIGG